MARQNIDINILGTTISVPMTDGCEAIQELGRSDYVRLDWNSASGDLLPAGSTITWQGRSYYLLDPYAPTQVSEREWRYTPQFTSHFFAYSKEPFFFHNATLGTEEPSWKLTGHAADFMAQLVGAMYRADGASYEVAIGSDVTDSYKSLEFNGVDIISACNMVAGAFETEIWLEERGNGMTGVLHLSRAALGEPKALTISHENDGAVVYGNVHPASVQLNGEYYNRFYVFGSTRNIPQGYQGANVNNLVNKRLTLNPTTYPNGYIDFAQTGERVMSKILIFDEIYPSATDLEIVNLTTRPRYRMNKESGNPITTDSFVIYYFQLQNSQGVPFVFDGSTYDAEDNPSGMLLPGLAPMAHFADGALRGQDFEVSFHNLEEDTDFPKDEADVAQFSLEAGQWWEVHFKEEGTYIIPDMLSLSPNDGDNVVLYNIRMPDGEGYSYVSDAQARLESAALEEISKTYFDTASHKSVDRNIYTLESNPVAFTKSNLGLFVGCAVTLTQGPNDILSTRVLSLRTRLNRPVCQTIEIGNEQVRGAITELKENAVEANNALGALEQISEINRKVTESYERINQLLLNRIADARGIWLIDKTNLVGGKPSVYLNEKYAGAYSMGFLSAGGLNSETGGGGGGGADASMIVSEGVATLTVKAVTAALYTKDYLDSKLGTAAFRAIGAVAAGNTGLVTGDAVARAIAASGGGDKNVQSDWSVTDTSSDAYIKNKPTIPSAPGTLITNLSAAQTVSEGESLAGTIRLHKVAKTGAYGDLRGTPDLSVYAVNSDLLNYIGKVTGATADNVAVFASGGGLADSGIAKSGLALLAGDQTFTGNNTFQNTVRANGVILDSHITPSADRAYNLGANDGNFKEGHIEDIYVKSFIPWKQQGATIPGDSNPASGGYNFYTIDANGRWNNGLALTPSEAIVGSRLRPGSDGDLSLGLADYRWGNLYARYVKATDSLEAGSIYAYNNATSVDFYVGNGSGGWLKALQLNNTQIEVNRNLVPNANRTYDIGTHELQWRYLFANRWYPNGASGPYIEYDSAKTAFKVAGNMYVTGFLTAGASGQNDVQSSISYSLVPTQSGAYNLGSEGYKFGTLYANTVRATSIHTTDLTVTNLNYKNWVTWGSEDNSFLDLLDGSTWPGKYFSTYGIDTSVFADIISGKIVTIKFYDNAEDIMHITEAHLSGNRYITIYFGRKFRLVQTSATRFTIYGTLN